MKNILIIGAGAMGSAFSLPCTENNNKVTLIGTQIESKLIKKLKKNRYHPLLKSQLPKKLKILDCKFLKTELKKNYNYVVIAVSSKGIDWVSQELVNNYVKKYCLIILTKGLSVYKNKIITISNKINNAFRIRGLPKQNITSIKGPCLAAGLINKVRTSTVIANQNISIANQVSKSISTDYYNTVVTKDVIGVEILGAVKNIYAMLIGASIGLSGYKLDENIRRKYFHNTSSALFTKSLNEMEIFTKKMNGRPETVYGLAGLGDLYVSIAGGRNSKMGYYLGNGKKYLNIKKLEMKNITTEGCDLAIEVGPAIQKKFKRDKFPIMFALIDSICKNKKLEIKW